MPAPENSLRYLGCVVLAAAITLIPNLPLIRVTIYVEAFNGFVLPVVLGFLLVLANVATLALSGIIVAFGIWMLVQTLLQKPT